jgi:hypothetical protein
MQDHQEKCHDNYTLQSRTMDYHYLQSELRVVWLFTKFPIFITPKVSLLCPHEPANGHYHKPAKSTQTLRFIILPYDSF